MTPLMSFDDSAGTSVVRLPESHVASHFKHLDLKNVMVQLMLSWLSCSGGAKGIILPKCCVALQFDCLDLRNEMVPWMTPLASCDTSSRACDIT